MNDILKIIILSIVSEIELFILTKLMGNREMSQLSMFDYIISITIGSIAAEMATSLENNYMEPLVAMIVYSLISVAISIISSKSIKFRRFIYGNTLILLDNGVFYKKNFKTAKLDLNEFLVQCRINGYFKISDIQTAILESNGKISFLPRSSKRPVITEDLNINTEDDSIETNVIVDGHILIDNLKSTGNDIMWLTENLGKKNISNEADIFLATCNSRNELTIYLNNDFSNNNDTFQ